MRLMSKKVLPTKFPDAAAVSYSRDIRKMILALGKETLALYKKYIEPELQSRSDAWQYEQDGIFDDIGKMLFFLSLAVKKIFTPNKKERAAKSFLNNVNRFNKHNIEQQMRVKGIELPPREAWLIPFMDNKIKENVGYITTIAADYLDDVEKIVREGVNSGITAKQMQKQLVERVKVTERRAQFIAVDQTGSILGQMTAERHQSIGIDKFQWDTSGDERVRDSHRELDGKIFSYDAPPTVGGRKVLPGEDYRCRCVAIPIFDEEI